jgi:hypothetical protein
MRVLQVYQDLLEHPVKVEKQVSQELMVCQESKVTKVSKDCLEERV